LEEIMPAKKHSLFVTVLLASSCVALAAASQATQRKIDLVAASRGETPFRVYCSSCHGKKALGDGPLAKDLKVTPANLTELAERNGGEFPYDMVVSTIEHGRAVRGHGNKEMPAWGDAFELTAQSEAEAKAKIQQLANYLWSLQKP